jgi:Dynamin family
MVDHAPLLDTLRSALGLLELDRTDPLWRDVDVVCQQAERSSFRIAVFGPFNYGKSTLLNALLGERTLPIDLIPTTGTAIRVGYGPELQTRIRLGDGTEQVAAGTDLLKQFAILDDARRMRDDVAAVEVRCPHPWLQTGVELLDLPGTNDREAQDQLVKDHLLTADLVVQVLDGRKLMTLGERENLRDWLLDRGITTVVFVVNFLNLLEPEEQKQVANRLRFVAESFRATLPTGISNLYRVDALPALRARLKGDMAAAQAAGLPMLESALQTIAAQQLGTPDHGTEQRMVRVEVIAQQVRQRLELKQANLAADLATQGDVSRQRVQIKQKAQQLINAGFNQSVDEFQQWFSQENLLIHQEAAAQALQRGDFATWQATTLKPVAIAHQQAVAKWVQQACDFFEQPQRSQLAIVFPEPPPVAVAEPPSPPPRRPDDAPVAVATGIGWVLGGPVGAAVLGGTSYVLNKALKADGGKVTNVPDAQQTIQSYRDAAQHYLMHFSTVNLSALQRYVAATKPVIEVEIMAESAAMTPQHYQLSLVQTTLENLTDWLK